MIIKRLLSNRAVVRSVEMDGIEIEEDFETSFLLVYKVKVMLIFVSLGAIVECLHV